MAGLAQTQISFLAIFILLGVGIDDMFIITDAFDRRASVKSVQERCALALEEVGASILFTSITDFMAFAIGSTLDLPAIHSFCITAAVAVLSVFVLSVTLYVSLLSLEFGCKQEGRYDLAPCVIDKTFVPPTDTAEKHAGGYVKTFLRTHWVPFVTNKKGEQPKCIFFFFGVYLVRILLNIYIYKLVVLPKTEVLPPPPSSSPSPYIFFGLTVDLFFDFRVLFVLFSFSPTLQQSRQNR